ncbi:hypothetical protein PRtIB026_A27450 [Pseudomonas sp. RtIB026]|nr:hypothetical protein PRtIB026_A27450 [Pseudomonas sp. RtIB026]
MMNERKAPLPACWMANGAMTNTELAGVTADTVMATTSNTPSRCWSAPVGAVLELMAFFLWLLLVVRGKPVTRPLDLGWTVGWRSDWANYLKGVRLLTGSRKPHKTAQSQVEFCGSGLAPRWRSVRQPCNIAGQARSHAPLIPAN